MNYIGSKHSLLSFLETTIFQVSGLSSGIFIDGFAGTGAVGAHFQSKGFSIIANDLQYYSYVLNRGKLIPPENPEKMHTFLDCLNEIPEVEGFISQNYCLSGTECQEFPRQYFSDENGKKCDAIRQQLERWRKENSITENEYFYLLFCLLEAIDKVANTASVYGAFLKHLKKSAQKPLILQSKPFPATQNSKVFNEKIEDLIPKISGDILYLDPPYNARQYAPNYHVLETIAKYDNPPLKGKTGLRDYAQQKSDFCVASKVHDALKHIVSRAQVKYIFLSYNNEGLMTPESIQEIFSNYGNAGMATQEYTRFKADKTENRNHTALSTIEYLHWVKLF